VCIPVYRGETFLAETIRSVLQQTYGNYELVVLDNASTDETPWITRSFDDPRIRIVTNTTTLPQPDNWRKAVDLCRAPLVKLVCADDLLYPRCLEHQVAAMAADPGLALVAARRDMIDESGHVLARGRGLRGLVGVRPGVEVARRVVRSGANPIGGPGGVLFRRADYDDQRDHGPAGRHPAAARAPAGSGDRAIGRLGAPSGRLRRRLLFALSARTSRRSEPRVRPRTAPVSSCGS